MTKFLSAIDAVFIYLLRPFARLVAASGDSGVGIYSYVVPSNSGQLHFYKGYLNEPQQPLVIPECPFVNLPEKKESDLWLDNESRF